MPLKAKSVLISCSIACAFAIGLGETARAADDCPNAEFRVGPSANLPDCRAYELVSPPDSGGRPIIAGNFTQVKFPFETALVRDDGESIMFQTAAGALPGFPGTGYTDRYLGSPGDQGWEAEYIGPSSSQIERPYPGGISADHGYYFVETGSNTEVDPDQGSLVSPESLLLGSGLATDYLRYPDGSFELVATGSLGQDAQGRGKYISPDGSHVVFTAGSTTNVGHIPTKLEPDAPGVSPSAPSGTEVVYDRTPGGETRVVSLLPGDVPLADGVDAFFEGASEDGDLIAFGVSGGGDFYVRVDGGDTYLVASAPYTPAGISGGHVFYADVASNSTFQNPGDLYSFDTDTQTTTQITNVGDARYANVSEDGSRVYFTSSSQINGEGTAGQPNLYVWQRSSDETTFVATLLEADVTGDIYGQGVDANLSRWTPGVLNLDSSRGRAVATNRSNTDGSVLVFEAVSQLTSFDNAGEPQIYRYDALAEEIVCISCVDTGSAPDASRLQSLARDIDHEHPISSFHVTQNLSADTETVVFESDAALVPRDVNGESDIYRWKQGEGVELISTGSAPLDSYLYGVTPDASAIAFTTPQDLVPAARNGSTRALYVAKVDGGYPGPAGTGTGDCVGDECQGDPSGSPADDRPSSDGSFSGNPEPDEARGDQQRCKQLQKGAAKHAKKARKLKRKARAANGKAAKRLNRRSKAQKKQAQGKRRRAKQCKRRSR